MTQQTATTSAHKRGWSQAKVPPSHTKPQLSIIGTIPSDKPLLKSNARAMTGSMSPRKSQLDDTRQTYEPANEIEQKKLVTEIENNLSPRRTTDAKGNFVKPLPKVPNHEWQKD